jgi:hypothetical protein
MPYFIDKQPATDGLLDFDARSNPLSANFNPKRAAKAHEGNVRQGN